MIQNYRGKFRVIDSVFSGMGGTLFFMMLFVPTTYRPVKAILLFIILLFSIFHAVSHCGRIALHKSVLKWTIFFVLLGSFFIVYGVFQEAPGALRVSTVYILWPAVFTIMISWLNSKPIVLMIFQILILSAIAIGFYDLSYILYSQGWLPEYLYLPIEQGQGIGFYAGYVEFNLYNISTLLFLFPFVASILLIWPQYKKFPLSKFWVWLAFALCFLLSILSGRRALLLVIVFSFFMLFLQLAISRRIHLVFGRNTALFIFCGMAIALVFLMYLVSTQIIDLTVVSEQLTNAFDPFHDAGARERINQFYALIVAWTEKPLLGAGHGAGVAYLRSDQFSWAYELFYVALLFQVGIVGLSGYVGAIIWIYWKGNQIIRSNHWLGPYMLPVLVGMTCFLLASATNPYLAKFDYMWVIFLPLALINHWLLSQNEQAVCE